MARGAETQDPNVLFAELWQKVTAYDRNADTGLMRRVYRRAMKWHEGQYRKSGLPYILHPLRVTHILADWHMDTTTIAAALLHDAVEDMLPPGEAADRITELQARMDEIIDDEVASADVRHKIDLIRTRLEEDASRDHLSQAAYRECSDIINSIQRTISSRLRLSAAGQQAIMEVLDLLRDAIEDPQSRMNKIHDYFNEEIAQIVRGAVSYTHLTLPTN